MKHSGCKGLVVAGTHSGSGKTTVTLGLLAALKKRGLDVAPFKIGPDFIDPGHHRQITGRFSYNLDGWMFSETENRNVFSGISSRADMAVVEGVMGLFDGYDGRSEAGSTAQMAKWLGLDILLVVDARSMARSAAAVVLGFTKFDPACRFCGVVFNHVASGRHMDYLRQAIQENLSIPVLGGFPRNPGLVIPDRHLGLVTAEDHVFTQEHTALLAEFIESHMELDRLIGALPKIKNDTRKKTGNSQCLKNHSSIMDGSGPCWKTEEKNVKIGVARDNAFCFYYPDNLGLLEKFGAKIVYFSPIHDRVLPDGLSGLYFGGGYPELHAAGISENESMKKSVFTVCKDGMPVYGECGGFMYLCEKLIARDGETYNMVGCFPFDTRMNHRRTALGYREVKLSHDTPLGKKGMIARGHEFHYSFLQEKNPAKQIGQVYETTDRSGENRECSGYLVNQCLGSYVHLHFRSCPKMAHHFVSACRRYQTERERKNASFRN